MDFVLDDFEDVFGPPMERKPEDRVSLEISLDIRAALEDRKTAPSVTVFHDGKCQILQTRPKWLGEHWGAAIIVNHATSKYALIIIPDAELIENVRFDPLWVKFPTAWTTLSIDGSGKTGTISHLDIGYFIPRGLIVSMSHGGLIDYDHPYTNVVPPLSNEHCIIVHGGVVYEVASLDFTGIGKPTGPYMRYGDGIEMTSSHYRGPQPVGCYNSICELSPGPITVYRYPDATEFIVKSDKPGVQFIWIDFAAVSWHYSHLETIAPVEDWDSLEWNTIPGYPEVDLSLGKTNRIYDSSMTTYDILLDDTVIMRPSGGEFTLLNINAGVSSANSRFDQFAGGIIVELKNDKVVLSDMLKVGKKKLGFWIHSGLEKLVKADLGLIKLYQHLWIASTYATGYLKCESQTYKIPPRRYKSDDGKPLSIVVPRFHVYDMDLTGNLFPVVCEPDRLDYTIRNLDLTFDDFAAFKNYTHEFKPGVYSVGENSTSWTFTEGPEYQYTCEGHVLPHFTNFELVKKHYAKFESVCKQIRDNIFMASMMDNTIGESDNVILDTQINIVPVYELPLPEPEKPAPAAASGPVLPAEVKSALMEASSAITKLSDLHTASQRSVASRIENLSKKADALQDLIERMVAIEQKLRESE